MSNNVNRSLKLKSWYSERSSSLSPSLRSNSPFWFWPSEIDLALTAGISRRQFRAPPPRPPSETLKPLPTLLSTVEADKWCSRLHRWKATFVLSYFHIFSCFRFVCQTLFACLGHGKHIWAFPHSLMLVAFSQQMKVKVLRSSRVLSLKYGLAAGVYGAGGEGVGLGSLKNQFWSFVCLSWDSSRVPAPPPTLGVWVRIYFHLGSHWNFIQYTVLKKNTLHL